jgi:hypothetical protein
MYQIKPGMSTSAGCGFEAFSPGSRAFDHFPGNKGDLDSSRMPAAYSRRATQTKGAQISIRGGVST